MMRKIRTGLIVCFSVVGCATSCSAQNTQPPSAPAPSSPPIVTRPTPMPPPPALAPTRRVGEAEVFYFEARNITEAESSITIFSNRQGSRTLDYLVMRARFRSEGRRVVRPSVVMIEFDYYTSQSPDFRFTTEEGRTLSVTADGQALGTGVMQAGNVTRWSAQSHNESVHALIPYEVCVRLANARRLEMQLGDMRIELESDRLQFLRDLLGTIEP